MRQRYNRPQNSSHVRAAADRKKLDESQVCLKHNRYYTTHVRVGARIAPSIGCPACNEERLAAFAEADRARGASP